MKAIWQGVLASSLCLAFLAEARFDIEKGRLKVKLPVSATGQSFETALANFGSPRYGGELV